MCIDVGRDAGNVGGQVAGKLHSYGARVHRIDSEIIDLAQRSDGLVSRHQLVAAGFSSEQIARRTSRSALVPIHRSVYALVDGPLSDHQLRIAACLAVPSGVLGHCTAGTMRSLRRVPPRRLEMTVPPGRHPRLEGVLFRRSNCLPEHHVELWPDGIRLTTPARTVHDLGAILDAATYRSVLTDAVERGIVSYDDVVAVGNELAGRGRPGTRAHRRLAAAPPSSVANVMSEGELALGDALVAAGIPVVRQHPLTLPSGRRVRIDLALVEAQLAIEVDHPAWHTPDAALQRDHSRDNELALIDWDCRRFTSDDVTLRLVTSVAIVRAIAARRLRAA